MITLQFFRFQKSARTTYDTHNAEIFYGADLMPKYFFPKLIIPVLALLAGCTPLHEVRKYEPLATYERVGNYREIAECVRARLTLKESRTPVLTHDHKALSSQMIDYVGGSHENVASVVDFRQSGKKTKVIVRAASNIWGEKHINLDYLVTFLNECSASL